VTWPWLIGVPVVLFTFIVTVLNVPPTIAANWQLVQSGVRRLRQPKQPSPEAAIVEPVAAQPTPNAYRSPPPPFQFRPARPAYNGDAVPTMSADTEYSVVAYDPRPLSPANILRFKPASTAGTVTTTP